MYVTDIEQWQEIGRAHGEVFGDIRPAASMVEVQAADLPGDAGRNRSRRLYLKLSTGHLQSRWIQ